MTDEPMPEPDDTARLFEKGALLYENRRYDKAQEFFVEHLKARPEDALALAYLSLCRLRQGSKKEASQLAEQAIAADPELDFAYVAASEAFRARGLLPGARKALEQALQLAPYRADLLGMAALLACDETRWARALELTEQGLAHDPLDHNCRNARSWALVHMGRLAEARTVVEEMLAQAPEDHVALTNLGWLSLREGERDRALEAFSNALRTQPESEPAREGLMEALRLRYPLYGLVLRWMLWMSSMPGGARMALVMVERILAQVLRELARRHRKLRGLVGVLLWLWSAFAHLTWTARPLANLLMRTNRHARSLLRPEEMLEANLVGLLLLLTGCSWGWWELVGGIWAKVALYVFLTMVIPVSCTFATPPGKRRNLTAVWSGLLFGLGLACISGYYNNPLTGGWAAGGLQLYFSGLTICQLMAVAFEEAKDDEQPTR
ncbi:MAG: tetratricopeptide repeat protein [Armatimonadetes bacterium]|nr:tetratricopeptide repeat protein [Armatimonadota bacterium]